MMRNRAFKQSVENINRQLRRGSTLILAVWSLTLLTVFAIQLGVIVRQKITLVRRLDNRNSRLSIASAGIQRAIVMLRKPDALPETDFMGEIWGDWPDGFRDVRLGKGFFTVSYELRDAELSRDMYGLEDEERKININKAGIDVLKRILQSAAGLSLSDAEELAYCIVDWRDNDSFFDHPQYGAEDSDYESFKNPYEAKDSDFELVEELLLVYKMKQEIFDKIKHFVTIYGEGKININTAPREVLLALGISSRLVDDIVLFRNGGDRLAGTGDDDVFLQVSTIVPRLSQVFNLGPSDLASLSNLVASGQIVTKSENFMIRSSSRLGHSDDQTVIVAVTDRTGRIKYWHEEI